MIETIAYLREQLAAIYDPEETRAISRWVIEHVTGYTPAQQILAKDTPIDPQQREAVRTIVRRLKLHEPIQYIVGECTFHGLTFSVNPSVLIPRPETGELVERIVQRHGAAPSLRVLDIGTGSGCIAITLSRQLLRPQVMALDLSAEAIRTAQGNAERNGAEVRFVCADLFDPHLTLPGTHSPLRKPVFSLHVTTDPNVGIAFGDEQRSGLGRECRVDLEVEPSAGREPLVGASGDRSVEQQGVVVGDEEGRVRLIVEHMGGHV